MTAQDRLPRRRLWAFNQCVAAMNGAWPTAASGAAHPFKVLEAGCGQGDFLDHFSTVVDTAFEPRDRIDVYGFDQDVVTARGRLEAVNPSIDWETRLRSSGSDWEWPFDAEHFDAVISNQVVEHVIDLELFFAECARVLKDDGLAIHVFPTRWAVLEPHLFMPFVHWTQSTAIRRIIIQTWRLIGLGRHREVDRAVAYIETGTAYRSLREVLRIAQGSGFEAEPRFGWGYVIHVARSLTGSSLPLRFRSGSQSAFRRLMQHPAGLISPATIVLRKRPTG